MCKSGRLCLWLSGDRQSVIAVFILAEISQFTLLMVFAHWLILRMVHWARRRHIWQLISSIFSLLWRVFTLA